MKTDAQAGPLQKDWFYKSALDAMPNAVILLDNSRKLRYLNRMAEKHFGVLVEECQGKPCAVLNRPMCGTSDCCIERFERGEPEAIRPSRNGERFFRISVARMKGRDGEASGYIGMFSDVTELVRAELRQKESEEQYRNALIQTRNVIWEYDLSTRTLHQQESPSDLLFPVSGPDKTVQDVPESLIRSGVIYENSAGDFRRMFQEIRQGEKSSGCTVRIRTAKGDRWMKMNGFTIRGENGDPARAFGVSRDVTEELELRRQFLQEQQYRDSWLSDAICSYEVNLSQNRILRISSNWADVLSLSGEESYTGLMDAALQQAIQPEFRAQVRNALSRDALLHAFREGKREVHFDYLRLDTDRKVIWVRCTAYLILSPMNKDVCAFLYLKNIDREKRRELELLAKAERDPLTSLYNRVTALARINAILSEPESGLCALFILDIDNFKGVNDTYGHLFGDAVLSEMAEKLQSVFRKEDILGRLGGDEFIAFLSSLPNEKTALHKAEQICAALKTAYSAGGRSCTVSASVGIAFAPRQGDYFHTLYAHADAALYHAKREGKNGYAVFMSGMDAAESPKNIEPVPEYHLGKTFSENIAEYVFKILYHSKDLKLSINAILELMARHFEANHAYIFWFDEKTRLYSMIFEWCAEGIPQEMPMLQGLDLGNYRKLFHPDGLLCEEDLSRKMAECGAAAVRPETNWIFQCAIRAGGEYCGFLGVEDGHPDRRAGAEEKETLKIIAEILGVFFFREK